MAHFLDPNLLSRRTIALPAPDKKQALDMFAGEPASTRVDDFGPRLPGETTSTPDDCPNRPGSPPRHMRLRLS